MPDHTNLKIQSTIPVTMFEVAERRLIATSESIVPKALIFARALAMQPEMGFTYIHCNN
jgi:hypothetical protein